MKQKLLFYFIFFYSSFLYSQAPKYDFQPIDMVIYYDSLDNISDDINYKYLKVIKDYYTHKASYTVYEFYKSGATKMKGITNGQQSQSFIGSRLDYFENGKKQMFSNYLDGQLDGKQYEWYENGRLKFEKENSYDKLNNTLTTRVMQFWNKNNEHIVVDGNGEFEDDDENNYSKGKYLNGYKVGVWTGFDKKFNYTYTETYEDGKLISGESIDFENTKYKYTVSYINPEPKRGLNDFYKYIAKNYQIPEVEGLSGKIYITFVVDKDGSLINFKVLRDIGYGTGKEAIRVLQKAEKWIPGKKRGVPIRVTHSLPINVRTSEVSYKQK